MKIKNCDDENEMKTSPNDCHGDDDQKQIATVIIDGNGSKQETDSKNSIDTVVGDANETVAADEEIKKVGGEEEEDDERDAETIKKRRAKRKPRVKKVYQCDVCHKIFQGLNDLRKHYRIHSDERPYACDHCSKKFRQAGCLKNHVASQHGTDTQYICHFCDKSFPIKERLRLHLRIHSGEKPYKCAYCQKTFARGGQLTQHLAIHNGYKKYRCDFCTTTFAFAANLKLHIKIHTNERDYTCHVCGKTFVRSDALRKHLDCIHANLKTKRCNICKKDFKGHLLQHMRTHKNVRPHGCAVCHATFSQRSQLIVHQRTHSGERPYRCQVCWQAFAHSSVLKLHIRKHTGEKPFKCELCPPENETAFSQLPHLKKHMSAIHKLDKTYLCAECGQYFKTKLEYAVHQTECVKRARENNPDDALMENNNGGESSTGENAEDAEIKVSKPKREYIKNNYDYPIITPMAVTRMRLLVAILLRRISSEDRLKQLGYEKRLIDNVLVDSLKLAERNVCEDMSLSEAERLKINIKEWLEWLVPPDYMQKFQSEQRSTEELLEQLTRI